MKYIVKSITTVVLAFTILLVNANVAFASDFIYPDYHMAAPALHNSVEVSESNLETVLDSEKFVDYLIEQLKVTDCDKRIYSNSSTLYCMIDISHFNIPYTEELWGELTSLIWYNSPELFRINLMGYSVLSNKINNIVFTENYTKEEYVVMLDEMYTSADNLLNGIKDNDQLSEVQKALLLHDRLALACQYDYDNYLNKTIPNSSYNAYGALVLNDAVCKGYTLAYDYLLEQIGIKSVYCSSDQLNHAWNIIYINDTPYHVDVTWDDPVWDVAGKVTHENFLRSTDGLISTGHIKSGATTVDYNSTPIDTTYDNYYWQSLDTAFQLLNEKIYFFNSSEKTIYLLLSEDGSSTEPIKTLSYKWSQDQYLNFVKSFSKLLCDGEYLYYNTPDTVFKFNPETNVEEEFFKPDLTIYSDYYWIYGLDYKYCKIICEIYNSPNFNASVKSNYTQSTPLHIKTDCLITKEPTTSDFGEKQILCKNCKLVLETLQIDKLLISTLENTTLDEENSIIFTSLNTCRETEELLAFSDSITFDVTPSVILAEKEYLGTGSVITIYKNKEKIIEYKIIVDGDLNGDSVCDVLDAMLAELCITNNKIPSTDECYAANGMVKDIIDINSFQYVVNTALKS